MTAARSSVLEFQQDYQRFCDAGGLGSAELYQLGRQAGKIADERVDPHRIVAFVLRSVLFDRANYVEGDLQINPTQAGSALAALDAPVRAAIASLMGPVDTNRAMAVAGRLLDARQASLGHLRYARD